MHGVLTAVNFSSTRKHQSHTKRNAVFCNKLVSLIDFRFHTTQCNKGKIDDVLMFFTIFCSIGELCMTYSRAALRAIFERFALCNIHALPFKLLKTFNFMLFSWLFVLFESNIALMLSVSRICTDMVEAVQPPSYRGIFCTYKKRSVTTFTYSYRVKYVKKDHQAKSVNKNEIYWCFLLTF